MSVLAEEEDRSMPGRKKHAPEEIVAKLRQVEVLTGQRTSVADAIRSIGVTEATYYRWRQEFGGLKLDQVRRLKELEAENTRLRKAVADLTLEKLILKEAVSGNWRALPGVGVASNTSYPSLACPNGGPAGCSGSTAQVSAGWRGPRTTRRS
jgi:putative transposase